MLDAFGVERTDISKKTEHLNRKPTAEEQRKARYGLGGMAAGIAAGFTQTPVTGGKFRGAVSGARGAVKGSMEVNRMVGGSKARGAINAARNAPSGVKSGVKSWKGYRLQTKGIADTAFRTYAPVFGAYGGTVVGEGVGELRNQQLKLSNKKRKVSKGLPSYLKQVKAGKAMLPNRQENQVAQWKLDSNKSGNAARKMVARKEFSGAQNNVYAGKQTAAFSKLPRTGGMVERTGYPGNGWVGSQASRQLRNADKGGFKTQLTGR